MWYKLEGKIPVPCSIEEADRARESFDKVAETIDDDSGTRVSTIFLRLDHNFTEEGPPVLFETMVFLKEEWIEQDCMRCCTWEEAEQQHKDMVAKHCIFRRLRFAKKTYRNRKK